MLVVALMVVLVAVMVYCNLLMRWKWMVAVLKVAGEDGRMVALVMGLLVVMVYYSLLVRW